MIPDALRNSANRVSPFAGALRERFRELKQKNPAYSLRAFARLLGVDQSLLSKVLKGDRHFSARESQRIGARLGLSPRSVESLLSPQTGPGHFARVEEEQFQFISDWAHFAILELMKTKDFTLDPKWIGARLGLHVELVRGVLDRLEEFGYFRRSGGKWRLLRPDNTWSTSDRTTEARRLLQKRLAQLSVDAIDRFEFEARDHGSLTLAIDRRRLPELKQALARVRKELGAHFQSENDELHEVYQLTMSVFPLTQTRSSL